MAQLYKSSFALQTAILTLGRLVALLGADDALLRVAVPLIAGSALAHAEPQALACLCNVLASVACEAAAANVRCMLQLSSFLSARSLALNVTRDGVRVQNICTAC